MLQVPGINSLMSPFHLLKFLIIFLLPLHSSFATTIVRHIQPVSDKDSRNHYFVEMLKLAMDKTTETHGPYKLAQVRVKMNQSRAIALLTSNTILDVVWTMTSSERESLMRPVRVPLLKGLLGHRIFIIRQGEEQRFASITDFHALQTLTAGQGHDWPDTHILRANGITVKDAADYEGLFFMLANNRFDYFPRGANEPYSEVAARPDLNLMVEENLLIRYPAPIFFFTNDKNQHLAERLQTGLSLATEDGSFNNLFYNHPSTKKIFSQAQMENRRIFELSNPLLTKETKAILKSAALWYKPGDEDR